jgi:ribosomal protein S14
VRFPRTTQRYKLVRNCVRRRARARAERGLTLYKFILQNGLVGPRSWAWAQEELGAQHVSFKRVIEQNLCTNSGRKRAVLRFFQLHRLEARSAFVGLRLPGLYYYY